MRSRSWVCSGRIAATNEVEDVGYWARPVIAALIYDKLVGVR